MAITLQSTGTQAAGQTSLSIPYPTAATFALGDILVMDVISKYASASTPTPSGWTALTRYTGGVGSTAGVEDEGTTGVQHFVKLATGSETGSEAVTVTSGNAAMGQIRAYRNSTGLWDWAVVGASVDTASATWTALSSSSILAAAGDFFVITCSENSSLHGFSSVPTITKSGNTFGTITKGTDTGTSFGTNLRICIYSAPVATGSATSTIQLESSMSGTTTATHPAGSTSFLLLKETPLPAVSGGGNRGAYIRIGI